MNLINQGRLPLRSIPTAMPCAPPPGAKMTSPPVSVARNSISGPGGVSGCRWGVGDFILCTTICTAFVSTSRPALMKGLSEHQQLCAHRTTSLKHNTAEDHTVARSGSFTSHDQVQVFILIHTVLRYGCVKSVGQKQIESRECTLPCQSTPSLGFTIVILSKGYRRACSPKTIIQSMSCYVSCHSLATS